MIWFQWPIQVGYVLGHSKSLCHPHAFSRVSPFFYWSFSARRAPANHQSILWVRKISYWAKSLKLLWLVCNSCWWIKHVKHCIRRGLSHRWCKWESHFMQIEHNRRAQSPRFERDSCQLVRHFSLNCGEGVVQRVKLLSLPPHPLVFPWDCERCWGVGEGTRFEGRKKTMCALANTLITIDILWRPWTEKVGWKCCRGFFQT